MLSRVIELPFPFVTQMYFPSNTTVCGDVPTGIVSSKLPSLARNLETFALSEFATQAFSPSERDLNLRTNVSRS